MIMLAPLDWVGFHYYTRRFVSDASRVQTLAGEALADRNRADPRPVAILTLGSAQRCLPRARLPSPALRYGRGHLRPSHADFA